jgi:hypothetical protein
MEWIHGVDVGMEDVLKMEDVNRRRTQVLNVSGGRISSACAGLRPMLCCAASFASAMWSCRRAYNSTSSGCAGIASLE